MNVLINRLSHLFGQKNREIWSDKVNFLKKLRCRITLVCRSYCIFEPSGLYSCNAKFSSRIANPFKCPLSGLIRHTSRFSGRRYVAGSFSWSPHSNLICTYILVLKPHFLHTESISIILFLGWLLLVSWILLHDVRLLKGLLVYHTEEWMNQLVTRSRSRLLGLRKPLWIIAYVFVLLWLSCSLC